jgi:PAS domain S-box-containing protein
MRNAPNPITVFNPDMTIRYANPALEELTGFLGRELVGTRLPFPWWPVKLGIRYESQFRKAHGKPIRRVEKCFVKKNGESFWVDVTSIPIKDEKGKLSYVLEEWIDITEQKLLNEQMEYYIRKVTEAQEQERGRIARELHDETAQSLSIITQELDSILHHNDNLPENIVQRMQQIKDNTNRALEEIRRFSHELRPGLLDQLGLLAAIDQLIEENNTKADPNIEFKVAGDEKRLSPDVELALFRITQEAINNVRKHSQASYASVRLTFDTDRVCLTICDNGKGFSKRNESQAIQQGHLGLIGMRERAHLIGANLKLDSKPGKGTTITVEIPTIRL